MSRRFRIPAAPIPATLLLVTAAAVLAAGCASTAPAAGDAAPEASAPAETEAAMEPAAEPATAPGPSPPAADAAAASAEAVAAAGPVLCFFGPVRESGMAAAGGGTGEPTADLLLRRTLEPESARIVEDSVRLDRAAGARSRPYTVLLDVDGDTVTLRESEGGYAGSGTLHGEPWRWTSWDLSYTLTSGIRVDAAYELRQGADGGLLLHGEKTAYGPDGSRALELVEELSQVPPEECEERLRAAGKEFGAE